MDSMTILKVLTSFYFVQSVQVKRTVCRAPYFWHNLN